MASAACIAGDAGPRVTESAFRPLVPVNEDTLGGSVEILVLTTPQGPQEARQSKPAQQQSHRYEIDQDCHEGCVNVPVWERLSGGAVLLGTSGTKPCSLDALPMTSSDEADIAIAAINGVTCPKMAIGTAMAL